MKYFIDFSEEANEGIRKLKKSGDRQAIKKLDKLLNELREHPTTGTGHPEQLKRYSGIRWSRHITDKHRLVYDIFENIVTVEIIQTHGHYDDK